MYYYWPLLGLLGFVSVSHAAIRVYNPETGQSEAAVTLEGVDRAPSALTPPVIQTAPPAVTTRPRAQVQPILMPDEVEVVREYPLGEAVFFVDTAKFLPSLGAEITKIQAVPGLKVSVLMESKDPKQYLMDLNKNLNANLVKPEDYEGVEMPKLKADVRGKSYAFHRPGGWHRVVYYDGSGSKRVYRLDYDVDKFLRHVKRVRDGARTQ